MARISVIFPVRNAAPTVRSALQSLLYQSYSDFEIIAIDDGSTDSTLEILEGVRDPRLRVIRHSESRGLAASLNAAIQVSDSDFIARMDGDDLCLPDRFFRQVEFLDHNPKYHLTSSNVEEIDKFENTLRRRRWLSHPHAPIEWQLLFDTPIAHPTVMFRRSAIVSMEETYRRVPAEDHDLWCRLALTGRLHRSDEVLVRYRVHSGSTYQTTRIACQTQGFRSSLSLLQNISPSVEPTLLSLAEYFQALPFQERENLLPGADSFDFSEVLKMGEECLSLAGTFWNWEDRQLVEARSDLLMRGTKHQFRRGNLFGLLNIGLGHPIEFARSLFFSARARVTP